MGRPIRIGFVALIDAASIIAAFELGYFDDEGLNVVLCPEIGWANVRDKLAFNRLDASHALIGHPIRSALGAQHAGGAVRAVMALGTGGDAITLSQRLVGAGVQSPSALRQYIRQLGDASPLVFAHVADASVHQYLLREWLNAGDVDPDKDVRLCVLPPPQMAGHMADRQIDGFCAGEPWNSLAHARGSGRIVALTSDIVPSHPDKVLAVNEVWAEQHPEPTQGLIRAIIRASQFCAAIENRAALAEMLSDSRYLGIGSETIHASLSLDRTFGQTAASLPSRRQNWSMRTFDATFPSHTHAAWMLTQMVRWGHASTEVDPWEAAARCMDTGTYRRAAESLGVACPQSDAAPMQLRGGQWFGPPTGTQQILVAAPT